MKSCNNVILAADDDREGEAIAWHVAMVLKLDIKNTPRALFSEITASALKQAVQESKTRRIDMKKVAAQEARRILDRILGYKVSGPLSFFLAQYSSLSAGRVQSVALKLVALRENAINEFVSTDHYKLAGKFEKDGIKFQAEWDYKKHFNNTNPPASINNGELEYWTDKEQLNGYLNQISQSPNCQITSIEEKPSNRKAAAPFITSSFQMACSTRFKIPPKKAMEIAQKLYEDGLITYMRTDNPNLSEETIGLVNEHISMWCDAKGLNKTDYLLSQPNKWKAKGDAQEAHEAIRPTDFNNIGNEISDPVHKQVYQMIFKRTVACQMASARYDTTTIGITTQALCDNRPITLTGKGNVLVFPGWKAYVTDEHNDSEKEDGEDKEAALPSLTQHESLQCIEATILDKKTKPPARFTQASLVQALESEGIGRPATYASIMDTILKREYVEILDQKTTKLGATQKGIDVFQVLDDAFTFMDVAYTRNTEEELDKISNGKLGFRAFMENFYEAFKKEAFEFESLADKKSSAPNCPVCKERKMFKVKNKNRPGNSWLCKGFTTKECSTAYPDKNGKPDLNYEPPSVTEHQCPKCSGPLTRFKNEAGYAYYCKPCKVSVVGDKSKPDYEDYAIKQAEREKATDCFECGKGKILKRSGKFGDYYSCDNYPSCKTTLKVDASGNPDIEGYKKEKEALSKLKSCPKCKKGKLKERKGAKGPFLGCTNYPKCKHSEQIDEKEKVT